MKFERQNLMWTITILSLVVVIGVALSIYVHNTTTHIREALAEEVLEQEHDVASLIHEYAQVMVALERARFQPQEDQSAALDRTLNNAKLQLLLMRSNYSFQRLDGAAKAHAFVKPILEDVEQWLAHGIPGATVNKVVILAMAIKRLDDRYPALRLIAAETADVATSLVIEQTDYLDRFRKSLIALLFVYGMIALGITLLLIRQRDLLARLGSEQVRHARRFKDFAEIGADWIWETDASFKLLKVFDLPGSGSSPLHNSQGSVSSNIDDGQAINFQPINSLVAAPHWPLKVMHTHQSFYRIEVELNTGRSDAQVISLNGKPLVDSDGQFSGYRGVGRDITARKGIEKELQRANQSLIEAETGGRQQAERALQESEKFLRTTLDALTAEIAILDDTAHVIAANLSWKQLVCSGGAGVVDGGVGQRELDLYSIIPTVEATQLQIIAADISAVLDGRRDLLRYEYPCQYEENQLWIVVRLTTFTVGSERFAVLVRQDVTERRLLEERDSQLRTELAHTSRLNTVGEMATGLAHELNQPLTAISHNCDALLLSLAEQDGLDDELIDMARDIYNQAQHAGGIIRSLRRLMRKDTVHKKSVLFNQLVEETVRLTHPEAREKNVNVMLNLADELPNPTIDPVQIQQVLVNLERNGFEAMNSSAIETRDLRISTSLDNSNCILVSVQDSGPGFAPEIRKRLFEPFQTTTKNGMGLGLSICRSIVESHGGRLWLEQDEVAKTILHFTLPITRDDGNDSY
jgi:signal transduction histidine kinase